MRPFGDLIVVALVGGEAGVGEVVDVGSPDVGNSLRHIRQAGCRGIFRVCADLYQSFVLFFPVDGKEKEGMGTHSCGVFE